MVVEEILWKFGRNYPVVSDALFLISQLTHLLVFPADDEFEIVE